MYLDPVEHAARHFSSMAQEMSYENYIEKEMYNQKRTALAKLKSIVHPEYLEEFAKIISFAHSEGLPEAEKISDLLFLSQQEFAAIEEDVSKMKTLLQEWSREEIGRARYEDFYEDII